MRAYTAIHSGASTNRAPRRSIKDMYAKRWPVLLAEEAQGLLGMIESAHALTSSGWRGKLYHTYVFVYTSDWFWIISVMKYPLHASLHPSMFDILGIIADLDCGKNRSHKMSLYSRLALDRLENNRLESVNVSQSIPLSLRFVAPVASIHLLIIAVHRSPDSTIFSTSRWSYVSLQQRHTLNLCTLGRRRTVGRSPLFAISRA